MKLSAWILPIVGILWIAAGASAQENLTPEVHAPAIEAVAKNAPATEGQVRRPDPFATSMPGKKDPFAEMLPKAGSSSSGPRNLLTFNVLGAGFGNYQIEYQRAVARHLSLVLTPSLWMLSEKIVPGREISITGISLHAGVALSYPRDCLKGLNVLVTGGFLYVEGKDQLTETATTWSIKATIGYRHILGFGLSLEMNVGVLYMPTIELNPLSGETGAFVNGGPVAELALGWAF
ncbi:MAG: hypothetical protein CVU65_07760 [Deltaproteobacteria bacterium HGW-Deltaproteobacteria-22]|jgi:hypothetical protein|nr:MAG: hypothetical protein CVU65_07760 [Deltaproteobacteria bacterium HGW-Deltaproteobacteria-22]